MNQNKISVRYAKALFELAVENNLLEDIKNDISSLMEMEQQHSFKYITESPEIKASEKKDLFRNIFQSKINELTLNFLMIILTNKREKFFPYIFRNFIDFYFHHKGIKPALLTTPVPLTDNLKKEIENIIKTEFNSKVVLKQRIDKTLIGGFILRVGDQQVDTSISTKLKNIQEKLLLSAVPTF